MSIPAVSDPDSRHMAAIAFIQSVLRWCRTLVPWRAMVLAALLGLLAFVIVRAGVRLPIAGTVFYADPREIFMVVGAALTGPIGSSVIAVVVGAARMTSEGIPYRILAYIIAGLVVALLYRSLVYARFRSGLRPFGWLILIPIHYAVSFTVGLGVPSVVDRPAYISMLGGDRPLTESFWYIGSSIRWEILFTLATVIVLWIVLPPRYQRPFWGTDTSAPVPEDVAPKSFRGRWRSLLSGRYLGLRLSVWFVLVSMLPFFGVIMTVENEAQNSLSEVAAFHRSAQAQLMASVIDGVSQPEMQRLITNALTAPRGDVLVVDSSGRYVAHSDPLKIGHFWIEDLSESVRSYMLHRGSGSLAEHDDDRSYGFSWTQDGRKLVVMQYSPRMLKPATERLMMLVQERMALALAFIALAVGLVMWFIVARPLRKLTSAVRSLDREHLSMTVPTHEMDDEVRVLGEAFNTMTNELRLAYRGLEEEISERVAATDEVQRSRAQLAEALRIARMGSFEVDLRGSTITLSTEAIDLIGPIEGVRADVRVSLQAVLEAIMDPDELSRLQRTITALKHSTSVVPPREEVYRFMRSDGSRAWLSLFYSIIWSDGHPSSVVGTMQDITARKRAEVESEAAKQRFQAVVENNLDAIVLIDERGRVKYASPSIEAILGRAPSAWEGDSIFHGIHEDDLPLVRIAFENIRDSDGASARKSYRMQHLDGTWVWIESIAKNSLNDPAVQSIVVNFRDISERKRAEEELLRLRQAVEISNEIVFMTDPDGVFTYVNKAFTNLYGYEPEEVIGQVTPRILKSGLMQRTWYDAFWYAIRHEKGVQDEITNRRKDGSHVLVEATANAVLDPHGKIIGYLAIQRDITERKRAEEALRHSEENLRVAQRIGKIGSWEVDVATQTTTWSREVYRILGRDPSTFSPHVSSILDVVHPDDRARIEQDFRATTERGLSLRSQHRVVLPDGSVKYVETLGEVEHRRDSTPGRIVGSIQDITENKLIEEALNDKLRRLQLLRELGFLFASSLEQPEIIRKVSTFIPQYMGVTRAIIRFVDPGDRSLVSPEGDVAGQNLLRQTIGFSISGRCVEENSPILVNDCRATDLIPPEWIRHFNLRSVLAVPIRTSSGVIGVLRVDDSEHYARFTEADVEFVSLVADQLAVALENARLYAAAKGAEEETERLNAELEQRVRDRTAQLEAVNQELESFSYSVSHDLRAPLRHISGFVELLRDRIQTTVDDESLRYLNTVSQSAVRLGNLIDELLAFSRIGRTDLRAGRVDLGQIIAEVRRDMVGEIADRTIEWTVGPIPPVLGDMTLLKLVLSNLLSNAVKFSRQRTIARIEVGSLPRSESSNDPVTVFIRDNGAGFDQAYAGKLFGVFQRLHASEEFEGTGIGLANVRRIVQRHGGSTWAEGELEAGATFFFTLPAAEVA